jgi:hypothetical protein
MVSARSRAVETFDSVLRDVLLQTGWRHHHLAAKLGVSTKTVGRYTGGQSVPPVAWRHGIVHALRELEPRLLARVAVSLGVSQGFAGGLPRALRDSGHLRLAVQAALGELAERLDASPVRVRKEAGLFLSRLAEAGLDLATAQTLVGRG